MRRELSAPRSDIGRTGRMLLMLGGLFAVVVLIFPIILTPGVEPPGRSPFGSALSMAVQISNRNPFMPLTDVEYSCAIWNLMLADGVEVGNANALIRGSVQRFDGRNMIRAPCETAYIIDAPIKAAEYRLTLTYRTFPWPQRRTKVYHIAAQIDGDGRISGWKLN